MISWTWMASVFLLLFVFLGYYLAKQKKFILYLQINAIFLALQLFLASKGSLLTFSSYQIVLIILSGALIMVAVYFYDQFKHHQEIIIKQKEELKIRMEQLHEFQLNIIRDDELERRALAGDLHDQILNDLKELKDNLSILTREQLIEKIDATSQGVREVMDNLSPTVLENLGLLAAIEDCLRKGAEEAKFKLRIKFLVDKSIFDKYSLIEQTLVYRIVQEVKNNICRHAKASKVRISAREENGQIKIVIEDNGIGIQNTDSLQTSSRGILYMKQRASIIGASVHWRNAEQGLVVEIFLPEKK